MYPGLASRSPKTAFLFECLRIEGSKTAVRNRLDSAVRRTRAWPPRTISDLAGHRTRKSREVALTFDDGPDPHYTPRVLDMLEKNRVRATFFFCGSMAEKWPELVREAANQGHVIGSHSWTHQRLSLDLPSTDIRRELDETHELLEGITGARIVLFRPPYGQHSPRLLAELKERKLVPVLWSAWGKDWTSASGAEVAATVLRSTTRNSIVLLHDGTVNLRLADDASLVRGSREGMIDGLTIILDRLRRRCLNPVALDYANFAHTVGEEDG